MTSRIRKFKVSPQIFPMEFRTGRKIEIIKGIPEGAQFRGFAHDIETNSIAVFVEHPSFDELKEGFQIPNGESIEIKVTA